MAGAEFPMKLPRNHVEAELMLDQVRRHLSARAETFMKAVDEAKQQRNANLASAQNILEKAKEELKDYEAEKQAMLVKLEKMKKMEIDKIVQRKEELKKEVEATQERLVRSKAELEDFKQYMKDYEQQVEEKLNKADRRLEVLSAVKKLYIKHTHMELEVDENKLITITMYIPDTQTRKIKEFSFKLQELTRKEKYKLINPHPEILKIMNNMDIVTDPGKCLFDIRSYLLEHSEILCERKSKKSENE